MSRLKSSSNIQLNPYIYTREKKRTQHQRLEWRTLEKIVDTNIPLQGWTRASGGLTRKDWSRRVYAWSLPSTRERERELDFLENRCVTVVASTVHSIIPTHRSAWMLSRSYGCFRFVAIYIYDVLWNVAGTEIVDFPKALYIYCRIYCWSSEGERSLVIFGLWLK